MDEIDQMNRYRKIARFKLALRESVESAAVIFVGLVLMVLGACVIAGLIFLVAFVLYQACLFMGLNGQMAAGGAVILGFVLSVTAISFHTYWTDLEDDEVEEEAERLWSKSKFGRVKSPSEFDGGLSKSERHGDLTQT